MRPELFIGLPKFVQQSVVLRVPLRLAKELTDINTFIRFICEKRAIQHSALISTNRQRHLVEARQWVMYYYTKYQRETKQTCLTLNAIGACLNKDHATVLHSINTIDNLLLTNRSKREEFEGLYHTIKTEYNA